MNKIKLKMITKSMKCAGFILLLIINLFQTDPALGDSSPKCVDYKKDPIISGLHTLSIHVLDTITHDSVFHFLADKLKLPVYYYPLAFGDRKYAGIYAGNLVLEPCGPYSDFVYATRNFRAIFFGLTFDPAESIPLASRALTARQISHDAVSDEFIYFKDSLLCGENITFSLMDKHEKIKDRIRMDSLEQSMKKDNENELGIEYVREIQIGYKDNENLARWGELTGLSELENSSIWKISGRMEFSFIKSNIKEVKGIVFKVRSLEKARQYLLRNNLMGKTAGKLIELDPAKTFGLSIYLTETE